MRVNTSEIIKDKNFRAAVYTDKKLIETLRKYNQAKSTVIIAREHKSFLSSKIH